MLASSEAASQKSTAKLGSHSNSPSPRCLLPRWPAAPNVVATQAKLPAWSETPSKLAAVATSFLTDLSDLLFCLSQTVRRYFSAPHKHTHQSVYVGSLSFLGFSCLTQTSPLRHYKVAPDNLHTCALTCVLTQL